MSTVIAPQGVIDLTDDNDSPPTTRVHLPPLESNFTVRPNYFPIPMQRLQSDTRVMDYTSVEDPIVIESDSDDEIIEVRTGPSSRLNPATSSSLPSSSFRIFSPPAQLRPPSRVPHHANLLPPVPTLPPPRIGLGGGFMAVGNRDVHSRYHSTDAMRRNPPQRPSVQAARRSRMDQVFNIFFAGGFDTIPSIPDFHVQYHEPVFNEEYVQDFLYGRVSPPAESKAPGHNLLMTHGSLKPKPGFTFNFDHSDTEAVIDVDSSSPVASSSKHSPKLVCARCEQSLKIGSKTMWALQCGHILCNSCIETLSIPTPPPPPPLSEDADIKGKGRMKNQDHHPSDPKRRLRPVQSFGGSPTRVLRPRYQKNEYMSTSPNQQDISEPPYSKPNPKKRRRGGPKEGQVVDEYEYRCPVLDCGRVHSSIKIFSLKNFEGKSDGDGFSWKPKDKLGAVPIFT